MPAFVFHCPFRQAALVVAVVSMLALTSHAAVANCPNITNATLCALPNCTWIPDSNECVNSCDVLFDRDDCLSLAPECTWNELHGFCFDTCTIYNESAWCNFEGLGCTWVPTTSICYNNCTTASSMSNCTAMQCEWNDASSQCRVPCQVLYGPDADVLCNADPQCMQIPGSGCVSSCTQRYTQQECLQNAELDGVHVCVWNGMRGTCDFSCGALNLATCSVLPESLCVWSYARSVCEVGCPQRHSNATLCAEDSFCLWNNVSESCSPTCAAFDQVAPCDFVPSCNWDADDSMCSLCAFNSFDECNRLTSCEWNSTSYLCQTICEVAYLNPTDCDAVERCTWSETLGVCSASCVSVDNPSMCGTVSPTCVWSSTMNHCVTQCQGASQRDCGQNPECAWSASTALCYTLCTYRDAKTCATDTRCSLNGSICIQSCNYAYTNEPNCDASLACTWNSVQGVCQEQCRSLGEVACRQQPLCMWFVTSQQCTDAVATVQITSGQYAWQIVNPMYQPSLVLALQNDLSVAYQASVKVLAHNIAVQQDITTLPYVAPSPVVPAVITNSVGKDNSAWLRNTKTIFVSNGGTQPLVVSGATSSEAKPIPPPSDTGSGMALHTVVLIAGCSAAALLVVSACAVWGWRHNPYAAARAPVQATERFTGDEYDRLKAINERVVTYEEAVALTTAADPHLRPTQWPVVARCEMPKNTQRNAARRALWDAMCTTLFPAVFEHLTSLRIAAGVDGTVRSDPGDALRILRYSHAVRLHAQGKGNIEFVMSGGSRLVMMNGAGVASTTLRLATEIVRDVGMIREPFERSGYCTHTGTNEPRKIVFGRIRPSDTFVVAAVSDAAALELPYLQGIPPQWTSGMAESAVRLMLRVASVLLESRRDFSDSLLSVHRGMHDDEWRIRADDSVIDVLSAVATRFWAIDDVLFFCGAAGIPIVPFTALPPYRSPRDGHDESLRTIASADALDHLIEANDNNLSEQLVG